MSKAPTGLTIARNGGYYTASWKCGDKNYDSGQQFQYSINGSAWSAASIGAKARSGSIYINLAGYYPNTGSVLSTVSIRVRGKLKKRRSSWSAWTTRTYTNYVPNVPDLSVSLDEQLTNKCTFTWSLSTSAADAQPYWHVRWETILVKESDVTDGSKLTWNSSQTGWQTGAGSYSSSYTITEDTTLLANAGYTRWFRVCGRGARGSSAWRYAKHVYARPYQAKIEHAEISAAGAEGLTCYARWKADQTASHPIDYTTVQYLITVPNAGLTCPSGAQWSDANISADTKDTDAVRFSIDDVLDKDECLFVRVNTVHDTNVTYSEPKLASVGNLKDPDDLSYQVDNVNHTLTSVSVDNNSDVPDSFIAIVYKAGSNPENEIVVGIIPHGASQPLVTPVQCPDWSGESAFSIGAYAAVGTYEANSVGYTVKAKMRSASTIWVGGAVPVAPENVNVVQSPITGTATVTWDWTWEGATFAQLSWTDHDDAWESTDEPEIYSITKPKATKWNISGLELGKKWYIAVRLVSGNPEEENAIYSPWSDMRDIILSSVPNVPSLNLSARVITEGEEITASWDFVSNDGTGQISAEIKDEDSNLIAHTETQKEVVIDTEALGWAQGEVHSLSVRVTSESNRTTDWSNPVSIIIAEALDCSISDTSLEHVHIVENERTYTGDLINFTSDDVIPIVESLEVDLDPIQDLHGYDAPWVGGAGKNKLNASGGSGTVSGVTFTNTNGVIVASGGATDNVYRVVGTFTPENGVEYILTGCPSGGAGGKYRITLAGYGYDFGNGYTFTGDGQSHNISCDVYSGYPTSGTTLTFKPMIRRSSESDATWQPYENICPISGHDEAEFSVVGKNLYDYSSGLLGIWCSNNVIVTSSNAYSFVIQCKPNTTYTVSKTAGARFQVWYNHEYPNVGTACYGLTVNNGASSITITTDAEARYLCGYVWYATSDAVTKDQMAQSVQVELGSTATTYEPYNSNTYTTALGRTVYGGTLDIVSGELTVTHKTIDLGDYTWYVSSNENYYLMYDATVVNEIKRPSSAAALVGCICSCYTEATTNDMYNATVNYAIGVRNTNGNIWVRDTTNGTSGANLKTFLTGKTLCYELATPQTYQLTPRQIMLLLGENNIFSSDNMTITVADKVIDTEILTELPLTVSLSGVNSNVTATLTIERSSDYHMDRPDETQFDGFEGEIVYLTAQNTDEDIIINQEDLIGLMDDGAPYRVFVTFKDVYGQSMSDSVNFEVHWDHQAIVPEASVEIDEENLIAKLTPIAPTGTLTGDTCDIYRLSADRPELIVKDAVFGTQYVDPYPAIGEFGGHRFVFKTVNGDYITEDNNIAWTDTGIEEDDILDFDRTIIDFDGNRLLLYYNVDVGHQWDKDFQETKYLGGSVQGDWNVGVSRSGSISATMITLTDAEQIRMMRELAVYTGVCHVRTKDGSSYSADVQVSEDRDHDDYDKLVSFSLTITRVDTENFDGLTYEQWAQEEPDE